MDCQSKRRIRDRRTKRALNAFAVLLIIAGAIAVAGCNAPFRNSKEKDCLKRSTCILGKRATIVVTTDGGKELVVKRSIPLDRATTALQALQMVADVQLGPRKTVLRVNGLGGGRLTTFGPERAGWYYRINGIEANADANKFQVPAGGSIWWDLRRFDIYDNLPVAIGVFPEPLLRGYRDNVRPLRIAYGSKFKDDAEYFRKSIFDKLDPEVKSIEPDKELVGGTDGPQPNVAVRKDRANFIIGRWEEVRLDPYISDIALDPRGFGLTVWVEGTDIRRQDPDEEFSRELDNAEGLIWASTIDGEPDSAIVVLVTGITDEGVRAAARALRHGDAQYFIAVAVDRDGHVIP